MRSAPALAGLFLLLMGSHSAAQPGTPVLPSPPAPVAPPAAAEPVVLPGGEPVSQPLQPVGEAPPQPAPATVPSVTTVEPIDFDRDAKPGSVLGKFWNSDELLIWWPKAHPLPPLVTGARSTAPIYGQPGTTLLAGTRALDTQDIAGYRLAYGWSLNKADTVGFEGRYFFLGTRTLSAHYAASTRFPEIGLPFINATTGQEDVITLTRPGQANDLVGIFTTTRVQGAEANLVGNLYADGGVKLHALAGYRFFQANEGLRIENRWLQQPTPESMNFKTLGMIADQFDAHNEFHGGQLGLLADLHRGPFYVELTGKVAFGTNYEVVTIDGASHFITAASPVPLLRSFPGGIYAQPTNLGRISRHAFAVVPEGTFKVGLKTGDRGRFFIGYSFLYISDAVRPGDQLDRTINPTQVPLVSLGSPFTGPDRPTARINTTDFWVQGLIVGFEGRF